MVFACLSAPATLADEADSQQIRDETEQVLDKGDIQRDAPFADRVRKQSESISKDPSLQHEPPVQSEQPPRRPPISLPIPRDVFLYLLLGVLGAALCVVAYHLYSTYAPNRRGWSKRGDQPLDIAARTVATQRDEPLPGVDEIERLAKNGAYAEAIHLMLLRALEALRQQLGVSWGKSLTSREIARRSELAPTDRRALKMLVGAVEISRFGGQGANEQIYRACLDHYRLIGSQPKVAEA